MIIFKHFHLELQKLGKILKHKTKVGDKEYSKSKIYLGDDKHVGREYELYDIGEVEIEEAMSTVLQKIKKFFFINS